MSDEQISKKHNHIKYMIFLFIFGAIISFITWFITSFSYEDYTYASYVPPLESSYFTMSTDSNPSYIFDSSLIEGNNCSISPQTIIKELSNITQVRGVDPKTEISSGYIIECKEFTLSKGNAYFIASINHDLLIFVPTNKMPEIVVQTSGNYPAQGIDEVKFNPQYNELFAYISGYDDPPKLLDLKLK
ncbi:MAG TPA: hypothetical protein VG895_01495 [Patescibacteria group bacterium]|nr:hypothetical protein [Patescibacteria group bacterium]